MSSKIRGGKKDKLKKFPRILDYLEVHHRPIYDIFDELAMHGSLTPRRGGSITFLLPDAKYTKEINEIAESDNPEEATKILRSLVLLDLFETPKDFNEKKDNIPTLLGTKLLVKSVSKDKVEIEDGTLTKDDKFRPFSNRENIAVWRLSGKVKYEGVDKAVRSRVPRSVRPSKAEGGANDQSYNDAVSAILHQELQSMSAPATPRKCPMLDYVVSALRHFENTEHDLYRRAKCLITMCPIIDFYLLFDTPKIFDHDRMYPIVSNQPILNNNVDYYKAFFNNYNVPALQEDTTSLLMTEQGTQTVCAARDTIRQNILEAINTGTPRKIDDIYTALDSSNALDGASPIYPADLHSIFQQNAKLHLMLDEFSSVVFNALCNIKEIPNQQGKTKGVKELFETIHSEYGTLDNPAPKIRIDMISVDPASHLYQFVACFWKTFGLHMPCAGDMALIDSHVKVGGDEADNPYSQDLVDVDSYFAGELEQLDNCPLCVSDHSIAEVKAYMNANGGKLPDGLQD
jgi:hypothetical protein